MARTHRSQAIKDLTARATRRPSRRRAVPAVEWLESKLLLATDITIATGGQTSIPSQALSDSAGDSGDYTIDPSALEDYGAALTLEATDSVVIDFPIINLPFNLTIVSDGSITVNAGISTSNGASITLDADDATDQTDDATDARTGVAFNDAVVNSAGNLTVDGSGYESGSGVGEYGVALNDSTLMTSGLGAVSVTGNLVASDHGGSVGVLVGGGSAIATGSGSITVSGTGGGTTDDQGHDYGVLVDGGSITSATGAVDVTGRGGAGSTGPDNYGVLVWASGFVEDNPDPDSLGTGGTSTSATISSSLGDVGVTGYGGGTSAATKGAGVFVDTVGAIGVGDRGGVTVTGTGGGGAAGDDGVLVSDADAGPSAQVTSGGGDVTVAGTGGDDATGGSGDGVQVLSGGTISAGGSGAVSVSGTGGSGAAADQVGVQVFGALATIASSGGDVAVTGQAGAGSSHDIGVQLVDATLSARAGGGIAVTGTGAGSGSDDIGVDIDDDETGTTVTTAGGDIAIDGTGGDSGGEDAGVYVRLSTIAPGGTGDVTITGHGGTGPAEDDGIELVTATITDAGAIDLTGTAAADSAGSSSSGIDAVSGTLITATASGSITLTGTGGDDSGGQNNVGVYLYNNTRVGSDDGPITIDGTGGDTGASGGRNDGFVIGDDAVVASTGSGDVTVRGVAGGGYSNSTGVVVEYGATIGGTSMTGVLTVTGTGGGDAGPGGGDAGISLNQGGQIDGGLGAVRITGTGGGTSVDNQGIGVDDGSQITSAGGDITIAGTGGGSTAESNDNFGVFEQQGGLIQAGGSGDVTITAAGGAGNYQNYGVFLRLGSYIRSDDGDISVSAQAGGYAGADCTDEIGLVLVSTGQIVSTGTGGVTITASGGGGRDDEGIDVGDGGVIESTDGDLSVTGTAAGVGANAQNNVGVVVAGGGTVQATGTGDVTIQGTGGAGVGDDWGIQLQSGATVSTAGGDLAIRGTGGGGAGASNADGVLIQQMTVEPGGMGSVTITGQAGSSTGGAGTYDIGVVLDDATVASAGGDVTVAGTGGTSVGGSNNDGVAAEADSSITAAGGGAVTIEGTGGASGAGGTNNRGVSIEGGSTVAATGSGAVAITGTGGASSYHYNNDDGVFVAGSGTAVGNAAMTGDLTITGTGSSTGGQAIGVLLYGYATIDGGLGTLTLTGNGGGTNGDNYGVAVEQGVTVTSAGGDVAVVGVGGGSDGTGYNSNNCGIKLEGQATIEATLSGDVSVEGAGGGGFSGQVGVFLEGNARIQSADGAVMVTAKGGGLVDGAAGSGNIGLYLGGNTWVDSTGLGDVTVNATGGGGDQDDPGVSIEEGVISTVAGDVKVNAQAGGFDDPGDGQMNDGLYLGGGSIESTGTGDVTVTGTGGGGVMLNDGIYLQSGRIEATGSGDVIITGTGGGTGAGAGSDDGVFDEGTIGATGSGYVTVYGTGGDGSSSVGVYLRGATIAAGTSGGVTITGTGGGGPQGGSDDFGVYLNNSAKVLSGDGSVTVTGTGGTGSSSRDLGVFLENSSMISATATGNVTVTGTGGQGGPYASGVYLQSGSEIATEYGALAVSGSGGGTAGLYGEDDGVSLEGATIASAAGGVMVEGTGGLGGTEDVGVSLRDGSAITASGPAPVSVSGNGGQAEDGSLDVGISVDDSEIAGLGGGGAVLHGVGGTGLDGQQAGIEIADGSTIEATGDGAVEVVGYGGGTAGDSGGDAGIVLASGSTITDAGSGTVDVQGHGGAGGGDDGVDLEGTGGEGTESTITSSGGAVTVQGTGGGQGFDGGGDDGVLVSDGAEITSGTGGAVTITGVGGPGDGQCDGVRATGGGILTSGGGTLTITGTGGGHAGDSGYDVGVAVDADGRIDAPAALSLDGTGGVGGGYDYGILVSVAGAGAEPGVLPDGEGPTTASIAAAGAMTLTGQGGGNSGSQGYEDGIRVDSGGVIEESGDAALSLDGTGGGYGTGEDDGVRLTGAGSSVVDDGDALTLDGTGGGAGNSTGSDGIAILDGARVAWDGSPSGTASIVGAGGSGEGGGNDGLLIDGDGSEIVYDSDLGGGAADVEGDGGQPGTTPGYGVLMTDGAEIDADANPDTMDLGIDLDADTLLVDASSSIYAPDDEADIDLSGPGTLAGSLSTTDLAKDGAGTLTLAGGGTLDLGGEIIVRGGTMDFAGVPAPTLTGDSTYASPGATVTLGVGSALAGVDLEGNNILDGSDAQGVAGSVSSDGDSTISPGTDQAAGVIDVGSLSLTPTDTVVLKLGGPSTAGGQPIPGTDYDQIGVVAAGEEPGVVPFTAPQIDLDDATLDLQAFGSVAAAPGTVYVLISNPAGVPIEGAFDGLPEGATVDVGGVPFVISYHGGAADNDDVILYSVAGTATTVAGPTGDVTYGQTVTLRAHVAGAGTSLVPAGTVDFTIGDGILLGSATLDAAGDAVLSTDAIPAGTAAVEAAYQGTTNFEASSGSASQPVAPALPDVQVTASSASSAFGQALTLIGSVLPAAPGLAAPTGTVTFVDETTGATLASGVPLVDGRAAFTTSSLAVGDHTIRLTYDSGDSNYLANSVGATTGVAVSPAATSVQLLTPSAAYAGSNLSLTALVGAAGFAAVGQGSLTFDDNGARIGTVAVSPQGVATIVLPDLAVGSQTITAVYTDPGGSFAAGSSGSLSLDVQASPTATVAVTSAVAITPIYLPAPSSVPKSLGGRNTRVNIEVQVSTGVAGLPSPTGNVTVYINGAAYGTYLLNAQGQATIMVPGRTVYNKTVTVTYNGNVQGNTTFSPATSSEFVPDRNYFYSQSPSARKATNSKGKAHPAGPAKAFRAVDPAAAGRLGKLPPTGRSPARPQHLIHRDVPAARAGRMG